MAWRALAARHKRHTLGSHKVSLEGMTMKFFVDTAEIKDIRDLYETGLLDGVTTNPSLIAKSGRDFKEVIKEICSIVPGPVSAEVASTDYETMVKEGEHLAGLAENVVVKLPLTIDGLKATKYFSGKGVKTNVTLCFSPNQALLAAKVGATYISPFIGRLDDINADGVELIENIRTIYDNYAFSTEILAASIRTPNHITDVALAGADVATIPPAVLYKLADHPLTKSGLEQFVKDWKSTGQSIL
jgi:transaldolase